MWPTDDGRIKPDLVANGVTLLSSHSNNNSSYSISSGTSMSSPSVAGSLLLLQEHYINVYGTNMTATMLKGLAIHTADEAGVAPGPDYKHGWGLLNAKNAALAITDDEHFSFFDSTLFQGQTHRYDFFANGTDPVKVTIAWNDTSGPVFFALNNPTARLVNNLDIRIRSYHCDTVIYPWTLNPANPSADATIGDNFRDNIEVIGDFTLPTGDYYVEVTHKNNLYSGKQRYSVIIQSSTYSVEPYDTIVYLSAPITLPIPESWVMPEPYFIWLSNSPKVNFILDEDSILVDAFEMGYDTLYLASCSQAWGCDFCDTVFIALDIRSCSENVNEQGSSQVVDIIPACSDDEGWFYFKDPVTNATLLGIKPNGNDFNPSLVRIDASTNGNFQLPPPLSASLMPYMLTINAPGTYNINGGLSVKLFYPSSSKNIVENDYEFSEWFKHPGSKEDVLNDFNAVPFSVQILEVQDTGSVNGVSFVVFDSISSFSTFGFTGWDNPAVLPVTWYSFDAKIQDKAVMLEWTTASEFNNKGFYVEYATNDLIFKNIGFVSGNGTTSIPSMYTFKHEKPGVGILYYRIRQVDFDGTFDYSVIRSVEYSFEVSNFINVYPNPAGDKIRVESNNALGFINIYDTTGRLMLSVNSDEKALDIDLANIHTGALFIQTKNGTKYILKN